MKRMKYLLPCLVMAFSACSDESEPVQPATDTDNVAMTVKTEIVGSRAMITDSRFPAGSALGITLVENKTNVFTYDGLTDGYYNVQYIARGTYPDQTWGPADEPIYLSATDGRALAYYPYSVDETDFKALTLKANGQTDYMYSSWVAPINNLLSEATFQMNHAMTGIRISLKRGSYTGEGEVKEIRLTSLGIGVEGTLDATTGIISDVKVGEVNTYMMKPLFEKFQVESDDYTHTLLMAVPVPSVKDDLKITVVIDDRTYEAEGIMAEAFVSGKMYTFKLSLENTALVVSGQVDITDWIEDTTASTSNGGVLKPTA